MLKQYEYDDEFQWKILAIMVQDKGFILNFREVLHTKYFVNRVFQNLCRLILDYTDKYKRIPTKGALQQEVKILTESGNEADLKDTYTNVVHTMYSDDITADIEYITDQVIFFGKTRAIENAMIKAADLLKKKNFNGIEEEMLKAFRVGMNGADLGYDYLATPDERTARRLAPPTETIPTGLADIDKYLYNGGINPGWLGIVMAPSSAGKSLLLQNMAAHALINRKKVLFFTFEMSEFSLSNRFDAMLIDRPIGELKDLGKEIKTKMNNIAMIGGSLRIKYYPAHTCTVNHVTAHMETLKQHYNWQPDIIFVDYADIMKPNVDQKDKRLQQTQIYEELVALAGTLQLPVWTANQANRGAYAAQREDKNIEMEHVGEAINKVHVADIILALRKVEKRDDGTGISKISIQKNREGISDITFEVAVNYRTSTMRSMGAQVARVKETAGTSVRTLADLTKAKTIEAGVPQ